MTTTINVAKLIGTPNAILHPHGMKVYQKASDCLQKSDHIQIDLTGLNNAISAFFHASFGNLFRDLGESYFQKIVVKGLESHPTWGDKIQEALDLVRNPNRSKEIEVAIASLFED